MSSRLQRLAEQLRGHRLLLAAGMVGNLIASAFEGAVPWLAGLFIDRLGGPVDGLDSFLAGLGFAEPAATALWLLPAALGLALLLNALFLFGGTFVIQYAGQRVAYRLRLRLWERLLALDVGYHVTTGSSEPLTRLVTDVNMLSESIYSVKEFFSALARTMVILVLVVSRHWRLSLVTLAILPPLALLLNVLGRRVRRYTHELRQREGGLLARLRQSVASMRVVRAFGAEEHERRRYAERVEETRRAALRQARIQAFTRPALEALGVAGIIAVITYGVYLVSAGTITVGMLIEFVGLAALLLHPLRVLGQANNHLQRIGACLERVYEVLDSRPTVVEVAEPYRPEDAETVRGEVVFEGVGFSYDGGGGRSQLEDISFRAAGGELVALVGPSGAGKSTLVKLPPRLYDPTSGRVLLDGVDVREWSLESLRGSMAVVPQEPILFNATVAENLRYGAPGADEERLWEVLEAVGLEERIRRCDAGLEALVGEYGATLSGGERQRLSVARAMLRDPRLLILDEATSSLDAESEREVQSALEKLMRGRTTLVIAHRLSTVRDADTILVLDGGRIVERGDHAGLLARGGLYAGMIARQEGLR